MGELIVYEMHDRHLIMSVFFVAVANWIEDKRHTPLVAALSFRQSLWAWQSDNQRRHSLPFSFSLYFFFTLYLFQSFSPCAFFLFFHTVALFLSPCRLPVPACLRSRSVLLVFFSLCLLLEDTSCKQSSSQRHTLHTISLAFKGGEYSQLCWKLNSLKPPFPLQQFIVGEFGVFGEQAWAVQRLMPEGAYCSTFYCSVPTSPPPFNLPSFPWQFILWQEKEKIRWRICAFVNAHFKRCV